MTMAELPDPSPHISEMSQGDLWTLVEELVRCEQRSRLQTGQRDARPLWWPPDVPWTNRRLRTRRNHSPQQQSCDTLRKVVRSCYRHHGQEHRLEELESHEGDEPDAVHQPSPGMHLNSMSDTGVSCLNKGPQHKDKTSSTAEMPALASRLPESLTLSGPLPAKALSSWDKKNFPALAALPEAEAATVSDAQMDDKTFVEIFICFYCEKEFEDRDGLQRHHQTCPKMVKLNKTEAAGAAQSRAAAAAGQPAKVRRPTAKVYKCRETHPDCYRRSDQKSFIDYLDLLPRSKLATFQKCKSSRELKCDVIEIDDCPVPKTPTTPRSAKSLISQLSRDLSPPPSAAKPRRFTLRDSFAEEDEEEDDDDEEEEEEEAKQEASKTTDGHGGDADKKSSKSRSEGQDEEAEGEEEEEEGEREGEEGDKASGQQSVSVHSSFNPRKITSLLAIDLCSPLGQRVKKHVDKLDNSERTQYEDYCHTPVKNQALERLRCRPTLFPVTFRKSKRLCPKQCHWYKFTTEDRREFMRITATGLNKRARLLKRQLRPCRVVLERLKRKDIIEWTTPKKRPLMIQQIRSLAPGAAGYAWQYMPPHNNTNNNPRVLMDMLSPAGLMGRSGGQDPSRYVRFAAGGQNRPLKTLNSPAARPMQQYVSHHLQHPQMGQQQQQQHHHHQQQRPYKAVLSGTGRSPGHHVPVHPAGGAPPLNVHSLPLANPHKNRNFGKPLQPGGFYGPNLARSATSPAAVPLGGPNRIHRPNVVSKENGAMHRNKTVRRLSLESPAKSDELTADLLRQLPSAVGSRRHPEDDVISISSTESDSEAAPGGGAGKRPLPEDRNNNSGPPSKRPRLSTSSGAGGGGGGGGGGSSGGGGGGGSTQVVLFRCHLCQAEITCKLGQTDFIQKHFSERHAVNNIHLLEHFDSNNQKVVTIVEDSGPKTTAAAAAAKGGSGGSAAGKFPTRPGTSNGAGERVLSPPNSTYSGQDRTVLRDTVVQGPGGQHLKGRPRRSTRSNDHDDSTRRSSDLRNQQRTSGIDCGPPEIIVLD